MGTVRNAFAQKPTRSCAAKDGDPHSGFMVGPDLIFFASRKHEATIMSNMLQVGKGSWERIDVHSYDHHGRAGRLSFRNRFVNSPNERAREVHV